VTVEDLREAAAQVFEALAVEELPALVPEDQQEDVPEAT